MDGLTKTIMKLCLVGAALLSFVLWHNGHCDGCIPVGVEVEIVHDMKRVTAYCACEICCGRFADGITASGYVIKPGDKFCASPDLPFGTILIIPGYGEVPVLDRCRSGLDVYFDDHDDANNWGVKFLEVRRAK